MSKFYNRLKSQKGTAIGTIISWSGDITNMPPGWIICDGKTLEVDDYPTLFDIIGYRYGGSGNSFNTPRLLNRAIVDYHPSHANVASIGLTSDFVARMGEDTANSTSGRSSNIDLFFTISNVNNFSAKVTELGINSPSYSDELSVVPRVLGDHHTGSHSHPGEVNSIGNSYDYVENCQSEIFANCGSLSGCQDQCEVVEYYSAESNGNATPEGSSYVRPSSIPSANTFGTNINGGSANSLAGVQLALQNTPDKNYIAPGDDAIQQGANNNGNFGYPVLLNHPGVNFSGGGSQTQGYALVGHDHPSISFSINKGNMNVPNSITIQNITTGNVAPINQANIGIGTIDMENIDTPSLSIIYIIRAY
jgi:hypothetical protein